MACVLGCRKYNPKIASWCGRRVKFSAKRGCKRFQNLQTFSKQAGEPRKTMLRLRIEWRPQPGNTSLRVSCTTFAHPIVQGLPAAFFENNPCFCVVFRDYLLYLPQTWSSSPGCGSGLIGNRVQIPDSPAAVKHREIPSICATGPSGREGFGKGVSQKTCQVDSMSKNPEEWVFDFDRVSQKS